MTQTFVFFFLILGYADSSDIPLSETLDDTGRIDYYQTHLSALGKAIK